MKKIALILTSFFTLQVTSQTNSQAFDWAFNTGGSGDEVKKMVYNSAGDLLVLGQARDTASFGTAVIGAPQVSVFPGTVQYLGKRAANGNYSVLFQTYMHPSTLSSITPTDFCLDANDNIFMMGTVSTMAPNVADFGNGLTVDSNCFFVAKLNPSGIAQWVRKFRLETNFTAFINPLNIACYPNGDVLFIAQSANSGANGSKPVRFIRLTNNGTEVWQREYFFKNQSGGPLSYYASITSKNGFCMDDYGNFYLKYITISDPKIVINTDTVAYLGSGSGAYTYFCAFNNDGLKKYYKVYNSSIGDMAVEKTTGNLLFSYAQTLANPAPFNTLPPISPGIYTYKGMVATDSLFNLIKFSQSAVSTSSLFISPSSIYPLGNLKSISAIEYCKGNTIAAGTQTYSNTNSSVFAWEEIDQNIVPSYFVAEPVVSGNCKTPRSAIAVNGNKVAVTGFFEAGTTVAINGTTLTANDKNATPTSTTVSSDAFITQFDRTLQGSSTSINKNNDRLSFTVYPNPANEILNISTSLDMTDKETVTITNTIGETVLIETLNTKTFTLNTEHLISGIYFITLSNKGNKSTRKFIKQ